MRRGFEYVGLTIHVKYDEVPLYKRTHIYPGQAHLLVYYKAVSPQAVFEVLKEKHSILELSIGFFVMDERSPPLLSSHARAEYPLWYVAYTSFALGDL